MTTKKNDHTPRNTQSVVLPASTATTALYFLQRVVVHGEEQSELFNAYQSLVHALTSEAEQCCRQCDAKGA